MSAHMPSTAQEVSSSGAGPNAQQLQGKRAPRSVNTTLGIAPRRVGQFRSPTGVSGHCFGQLRATQTLRNVILDARCWAVGPPRTSGETRSNMGTSSRAACVLYSGHARLTASTCAHGSAQPRPLCTRTATDWTARMSSRYRSLLMRHPVTSTVPRDSTKYLKGEHFTCTWRHGECRLLGSVFGRCGNNGWVCRWSGTRVGVSECSQGAGTRHRSFVQFHRAPLPKQEDIASFWGAGHWAPTRPKTTQPGTP
eukprot:8529332-Alexandrium_andersonii.AAC.1